MPTATYGAAAIVGISLLSGSARTATGPSVADLEWRQVVASYASVTDYTSVYEKEERVISNGEMQRIRLSFRKPFDVRLEWLKDGDRVDQIAVYRQGHNDGKLLARRTGMFGLLIGTVHLDPRESEALADSRHPITDVGIGYIVERIEGEALHHRLLIHPAVEDLLDQEPHDRFELDSMTQASLLGIDGARRGVVWVNRSMKLPVKVEIVDAAGVVLERHRFKDLRVNVGLADATFAL